MSQDDVTRKIYYKRAVQFDAKEKSFEASINMCHQKLNTTEKRSFSYNHGRVECIYTEKKANIGTFMHISFCYPGSATSLIPDPSSLPTTALEEQEPPDGKSFLEGDVFAIIQGNHVVMVRNQTQGNLVEAYCRAALSMCQMTEEAAMVDLEQIANIDKLALLQEEGLAGVALSATLYEATRERFLEQKRSSLWRAIKDIGDEVRNIFASDDAEAIEEAIQKKSINIRLLISLDQRTKGLEILSDRFDTAGEEVLADSDGFVLVTKKGRRILPDQVAVTKQGRFHPSGRSLSRKLAFAELQNYLDELKESGVIMT